MPAPGKRKADSARQLKAKIGYLDLAKVHTTGLPMAKLKQMNAAMEKHLQSEVGVWTVSYRGLCFIHFLCICIMTPLKPVHY